MGAISAGRGRAAASRRARASSRRSTAQPPSLPRRHTQGPPPILPRRQGPPGVRRESRGRRSSSMDAARPAGIILAGGRSRRLGRDKARLLLGRRTMLEHVRAALGTVCSPLLVVGRAPATAVDRRITWVADRRPGWGPLAGLEAGLAE